MMQRNVDQSQFHTDQSNDRTTSYQSVPVSEAARILGISPEAVRARIQRGTLPKEKGSDGTVYVRLDAGHTRSYGDKTEGATAGRSSDQTQLVDSLGEQISFLRAELVTRNEELRRKDHIIAALTERIPELPAPAVPSQESRESSETPPEEPANAHAPPEAPGTAAEPQRERSWWREFLGME